MPFIYDEDRVIIISATDSFLAKSLLTKLEQVGILATFILVDKKSFVMLPDKAELVILFLSDELAEMTDLLISLKDQAKDKGLGMGLMLIGDQQQFDMVQKSIPKLLITDFILRPIDVDIFLNKVEAFVLDEGGEKRKKKILIVDDDVTYMRTVYEWLKGVYHVDMASSGVQAIRYLAKNHADLILMDYEMPVADGKQVLAMLKSNQETGDIPVMFLSGHGERENVMSVVDLKPVDYLLKTISREKLLEKLVVFFASRE